MGMIGLGAVIQALVTLLEYGSHGAAVDSPGGMVVYLGLGTWRPDEDLQREGVVPAFVAMGYVPICSSAPRLFPEGKDLSYKKGRIVYKMGKVGCGLL
jgi:hypothetical protein